MASDAKRKTASAKAAKRKAAPAKAKAKPGGARPRSDGGQSARSRLVELKRRLREMASLPRGPGGRRGEDLRQGEGEARRNCRSSGRQAVGQRGIGQIEAGGAEAAAAGGHDLGSAGAVLGWDQTTYMPPGRRRRAGAPERDPEPAGAREVHRSGDRQAARRPAALCGEPAVRLRRRRLIRVARRDYEQGGQGAGRVRRALRARTAPPPTMPGRGRGRPTTSPPCARCWRRRSTSAAQYADFFPGYEHIADPLIDGPDDGHDGRHGARAVRRAARASWCRSCAPSPRSRPPTTAACAALSRGAAAGVRPRRRSGASATTSSAAGRTRRTIRSAPSSRSATCASPRASTRTTSARRCSARCTRPATRSTSRASTPDFEGTPLARAPRPACTRASRACGRTWSAAAAASGILLSRSCRRAFPEQLGERAAGHLLPRHQQGRALADPHRRRRGDLQPACHAALRSGAGPAGGPARGARPARGLARALQGRPGHRAAGRPRRRACRMSTGTAARSAARSRATRSAIS